MSKAQPDGDSAKAAIEEVSKIVSEMSGIQLGARQASMVENRLKARMVKLSISSFGEYLRHLRAHMEQESQALLSLMTTHHTYFFREFSHFEYLLKEVLPPAVEAARARADKVIRIWSAACSRGQEVYSLAMFFKFHLKIMAPDISFEIWGTDVDPESVSHAKNGVYRAEELRKSPAIYVEGNWTRGTGNVSEFSKVKNTLKQLCKFEVVNLLKPQSFLIGKTFDIILCRNVYIYFNQQQIKSITKDLLGHMDRQGFLVLGVSETLNGLGLEVDLVGPSIYQLKSRIKASPEKSSEAPARVAAVAPVRLIDVLCVDDSPTIHALLGKILTSAQGFRVKGKALNGQQALDILKTEKFDIITLDLHMPELDGIGFLKAYTGSIPVIVLSAINRDDPSVGQKAIALGAKDYVEKPSLENLSEAGNEIRSKIKTVLPAGPSHLQPVPAKAMTKDLIRVLVVDDSATIRKILIDALKGDRAFEIVGESGAPLEVEKLVSELKPDVITMDIHMPDIDGVALVKKLVPKFQIPIVMISSMSREDGPQVFEALESGAVDYIQKPQMSNMAAAVADIRERVRNAAHAKISVRSRRFRKATVRAFDSKDSLVLLGASTGGTEALKVVLESLPDKIPPILIVQHIPPVFSAAFAERLNGLCAFEVKEAKDGDEVVANRVLVAPGGKQMGVRIAGDRIFIRVTDDLPVNRHKPSVDYLFKSVREAGIRRVVAGVLTGMGADGARELKMLRDAGARTFAQDKETSVVYGMPKEAAANGGAESIVALEMIADRIVALIAESTKMKKAG